MQDRVEEFDKLYSGKKYSSELISLVELCLIKNPVDRLSCSSMMKKKFIRMYQSTPSSELLKILKLTNPIQLEPQAGNAY